MRPLTKVLKAILLVFYLRARELVWMEVIRLTGQELCQLSEIRLKMSGLVLNKNSTYFLIFLVSTVLSYQKLTKARKDSGIQSKN